MTAKKSTAAKKSARKSTAYRDSRTGAIRRSFGKLGFPYVEAPDQDAGDAGDQDQTADGDQVADG